MSSFLLCFILSGNRRAFLDNGNEDFAVERAQLVDKLRFQIKDSRVLDVMSRIPRELFVPWESRSMAYEDRPLPIGMQQTISQPFMVAWMTSAAGLTGKEKVLEIGTGSGYQTAILAELARQVVSVERIPHLASTAERLLARLGYTNIEVHVAGLALGWPQLSPYQAILVTAGAPKIPDVLLEQLSTYGRLIIPIGSRYDQELVKVTKLVKTNVVEYLGGCRFVPLIGPDAWEDN